eukprot:TRINITY_DN41231_c0_g1_i1.p1 TRINITY_DN41231_c0_g1~~TRINITY_DN41231_c0_g1_i1.p1  ORF type:complete len:245 (+),score=14.93 TRINITY_DN41231_c0_g1_i1:3-737(+)
MLHRTFAYSMCMLWVLVGMNEARNVQRTLSHIWCLPTVARISSMLEFVQTGNFAADGKCHIVGLTRPVRIAICFAVCLPRIWVTFYLTSIGCRWLCASSGPGEMILNSLKLSFVHKIDEVVYEVVLPLVSRKQIADTKMFFRTGAQPSSLRQVSNTELTAYFRSAVYVLLTAICVFGYIELYQTVLPTDMRHLRGLCNHWRHETAKLVCDSHAIMGPGNCYPQVNLSSFEVFLHSSSAKNYRVH